MRARDVAMTHEQEMLLQSVRTFMAEELYPNEEEVDQLGHVPEALGRQIEKRAIEVGLYSANLPEAVGGGGLDYASMAIVERSRRQNCQGLPEDSGGKLRSR